METNKYHEPKTKNVSHHWYFKKHFAARNNKFAFAKICRLS